MSLRSCPGSYPVTARVDRLVAHAHQSAEVLLSLMGLRRESDGHFAQELEHQAAPVLPPLVVIRNLGIFRAPIALSRPASLIGNDVKVVNEGHRGFI